MKKPDSQADSLTVEQRRLVNKRLSLNLLIQGAAAHAHWSAHHFVADALNQLDRELLPVYDELMLRSRLGYWLGGMPMIMGSPTRFWLRLEESRHEFAFHPFFVKHGYRIARLVEKDVMERCQRANVSKNAPVNEMYAFSLYQEALALEEPHIRKLEQLAKDVCCELYGIESRRMLNAKLTQNPKFGKVRAPKTAAGREIIKHMIGWSAVVRAGKSRKELKVKARATFWSLLIHELVKGTVELISLHGLNELSEEDYEVVMDHTEHIEFEIPMLQIGGFVFQRLLEARPREIPLADCICEISKMAPCTLDSLLDHLVQSPNRATDLLRRQLN